MANDMIRVKQLFKLVTIMSLSALSSESLSSGNDRLITLIDNSVNSKEEYYKNIYKDLHQNPELGFMEFRTAGIISDELSKLGYSVTDKIAKTGVAAVLKNGDGPVFMFRADMDANSVKEATNLPYASKKVVRNLEGIETPVAHQCGHDAHSTWLLGLANTMVELKDEWQGTLVLIAQPAEEPVAGAKAMIDDGLYSTHQIPKPDYFLALHSAPISIGSVMTNTSRLTTGTEHVDITFHGKGGHGSSPHKTRDPVVMAGMAIVQLQSVVSRQISPEEVGVLTIGSVSAGIDNNVIPSESHLRLKLHFSDQSTHDQLINGIKNTSNAVAASYGVAETKMPTLRRKGYASPIINDQQFTTGVVSQLRDLDDITVVHDKIRVPGSDDAFMLIDDLESTRGVYLFIGTVDPDIVEQAKADGQQYPFMPHAPDYQVSLDAIPLGAKLASKIAIRTMNKKLH